VRRKIK